MKEFNSSEENYAGRSNGPRVAANQSRGSGRLTSVNEAHEIDLLIEVDQLI